MKLIEFYRIESSFLFGNQAPLDGFLNSLQFFGRGRGVFHPSRISVYIQQICIYPYSGGLDRLTKAREWNHRSLGGVTQIAAPFMSAQWNGGGLEQRQSIAQSACIFFVTAGPYHSGREPRGVHSEYFIRNYRQGKFVKIQNRQPYNDNIQ